MKQRELVSRGLAKLQEKGIKKWESLLPTAQFPNCLPKSWAMKSIGKAIYTNPEGSLGTAPLK